MIEQTTIDVLRNKTVPPQHHFINGSWQQASSGKQLDVISPIDGQAFTSIAQGNSTDIDFSVQAAKTAFEKGNWSRAAPDQRKKVLFRLAELIEQHSLELAVLGVRDNGTEINMAITAEPGSAANTFRYYAEAIDKVYGEIAPTAPGILGLVHREPLGVIGAIVPWNFPLMIGAWKVAPALAAGNSVVLKPAENASLSLLRLAELATEAGIPEGVLNVVTGFGAEAGEALALHMDVAAIAFTGSGSVGRRLMEYSARSNLKRVWLELGGKSPNIVFSDAPDLEVVAQKAAFGIFRNQGQVCVAGSRLLVQSSIHKEFVERLKTITMALRVGDPLDLNNDVGAISSSEQLAKDIHHIEQAETEGAQRVCGGEQILQESGGYYLSPTIFDGITYEMSLAREEVFGPVLAVMQFEDEEQAVQLANNTVYGLASAVWTSNLSTAHRMIQAINAGTVFVNTYGGADITVPLGGVKQSGFGRDKSLHAFEKYTDLKTAWIAI